MNTFRAISDKYGGLVRTARFVAVIRPRGQDIIGRSPVIQDIPYLCETAEIPGRGFTNIDVRYYGPSSKFPFLSQYEDINMTFLCRTASLERQFFDDWMTIINPPNIWDFSYRDDYEAEIDVYQFGEFGQEGSKSPIPQYRVTLKNAWPTLVNPQPVTWADDQFQRIVVSFTYSHWYRRDRDPEPIPFDLVIGRKTDR